VKLNRFRPRMNIEFLRNPCWKYGPVHLYISALEFLMPDGVGEKRVANHALPVRGEHIVDLDVMNVWQPHSHYIGPEGVCYGCLELRARGQLEPHLPDQVVSETFNLPVGR